MEEDRLHEGLKDLEEDIPGEDKDLEEDNPDKVEVEVEVEVEGDEYGLL